MATKGLDRKLSSESIKDNLMQLDGSETNTKRFKLMKIPLAAKELRRFERSELEKPVMVKALFPDPDLDPDDFKAKKGCDRIDIIKKEEEILSALPPHPNVNGFYGLTEDMRVLILEEVRTDLATVLHLTEHLIPITILKWTRDILLGLAHIHNAQVIHQDICPKNICITSQYRAQVSEFSRSCKTERQEQIQNKQRIGTLSYRAPELIMGAKVYNNKIDCWSVGIVILEMLLGDCPVPGLITDVCTCQNATHLNFNFDQLKRIFKLVGSPTDEAFLSKMDCFAHFSSWRIYRRGLKQKVWEACILDHKPQHGFFSRKTGKESIEKTSGDDPITLEELKAYSGWYEVLEGLLKLDPNRRITAKQALGSLRYFDSFEESLWNDPHMIGPGRVRPLTAVRGKRKAGSKKHEHSAQKASAGSSFRRSVNVQNIASTMYLVKEFGRNLFQASRDRSKDMKSPAQVT